jgi:alkanesulfonate monooxygenase SsuD/methylene tetrahydromethanopterin reductase-like flavin-dependent oxidoreductase (luciferase family)
MVKFALSLPIHLGIDELVEQAFLASVSGFDYVLMPDHIYSLRGTDVANKWDVLSVIASNVNIGVGTMVANIYREDIDTIVQHVKTLKMIAKKKDIVVGLGRGTAYDTVDIDTTKAEVRMELLLRKLPYDVLKIVAARGSKMKGVACDFGNGWMPRHGLSFKEYRDEKRKVEKRCLFNSTFVYCADIPVVFNETEQIMKSLAYRYLFQKGDYFYSNMDDKDRKLMDEESKQVDKRLLRERAVIGDVKAVTDAIGGYVTDGVEFFSIRLYDDEFDKFKRVIDAINN